MPTDKMVCVKRPTINYCWNLIECRAELYHMKRGKVVKMETRNIWELPKDVINKIMQELSDAVLETYAEKEK